MEYFKIGKITAPVGIKGEIRVYPYTDEITRFSAVKELTVEGEQTVRTVEKFRADKNMVVLKLSGIDDRNTSETYRNKFLLVDKEKFELEEDVFYADDLIGMEVYDEEGKLIGELTDILNKPTQDLYEISYGEDKKFVIPAVKEFILDVNIDENKMTVHLIDGLMDL